MDIRQVLNEIQPLTEDEYLEAKSKARNIAVREFGDEPEMDDFTYWTNSVGTSWWMYLTAGILMLAMFSAFALSMFRVFTAGRDLFLLHIPDPAQAAIAGIATFFLAELLVLGSMFARAIYFEGVGKHLMIATVAIGVAVALMGNLVISNPPMPGDGTPLWEVLFAWLDAIVPPVAVMMIAYAFEKIIVERVHARKKAEAEYRLAYYEWKEKINNIEDTSEYRNRYLFRALKDAILKKNLKGRGAERRKEILSQLPHQYWAVLAKREVERDTDVDLLNPTNNKSLNTLPAQVPQTGLNLSSNVVPFANNWPTNGDKSQQIDQNGGFLTNNSTNDLLSKLDLATNHLSEHPEHMDKSGQWLQDNVHPGDQEVSRTYWNQAKQNLIAKAE